MWLIESLKGRLGYLPDVLVDPLISSTFILTSRASEVILDLIRFETNRSLHDPFIIKFYCLSVYLSPSITIINGSTGHVVVTTFGYASSNLLAFHKVSQ